MWNPDSIEAHVVRQGAYEQLRKERLEFEALHMDAPRTHLEGVLRKLEQRTEALNFTEKELDRLRDDVIYLCVKLAPQKNFRVKWDYVLRGLRQAKFAPLQSPHKWKIPIDAEETLKDILREQGFVFSTKDDYTIAPSIDMQKKAPRPIPSTQQTTSTPVQQPGPKLLKLPSDAPGEVLEELLAELADPKVAQSRKKQIRAKLRRMGHQGGLRHGEG